MQLSPLTAKSAPASAAVQRLCGYAAAVAFPWITADLSNILQPLHRTPLALSFACLAAITLLGGIGPGVVAAVSAAVAFNYYDLTPERAWSLGGMSLLRTAVVLSVGLFVAWLCHRQRIIGHRLHLALQSLQSRTDALVEAQQASNSVAWTFSLPDRTVQWAEGGAEIFGRPFADFASPEAPFDLILPEDRAHNDQMLDQAIAIGQSVRVEFRVRWPNGELHWIESRGTTSPNNPNLWRGVAIDITDRKNAELALIRSEKLAAIGRLSATIAHEINNPLEAVTNLIYLAGLDQELHPQTRAFLLQADRELGRLASIARHTLTFVRPGTSTGPLRVFEIAESVVAIFQPKCLACGNEIRLHCASDPYLAVPGDDLRQILTNVLSNACDAVTGPGGLIEVELLVGDESVCINVRDNGGGIPRDHLNSIFDPFFTTKESLGTGIGLWISRELVQKNGGSIRVQVEDLPPGFSTMFSIELPLLEIPVAG
jgi:PAS domain S-box-containing protein